MVLRVFKGLLWGLFNSMSITWIPGWFKGAFTSPATEVTTERSCKPGLQSQVYYSWHSRRVGSFSIFSSGFREFHLFFPQRLSDCWESNFGQENTVELNEYVSLLLPKGRKICLWIQGVYLLVICVLNHAGHSFSGRNKLTSSLLQVLKWRENL